MRKKIALVICLTFTLVNSFSQNAINYSISKTISATAVGGDLIIDNGSAPAVGGDLVIVNNNLCIGKNIETQNLFESVISTTVSFDINNRGGGNSCVTLIVETTSGRVTTVISADSQSGVLKFGRVRKAFLLISKKPNDIPFQIATAIGIATVWF